MWGKVAGAVDPVDKILSSAGHLTEVLEKDRKRIVNITEEVFAWRCYLRSSEYLQNCLVFNVPISIQGKFLSNDLVNLSAKCASKRRDHWSKVLSGTKLQNAKVKPLRVLIDLETQEIDPYVTYSLESDDEL